MRLRRPILLTLLLLATSPAAAAQEAAPLPGFVASIARLWAAGEADAIVALSTRSGRILLDVGEGTAGEVRPRNAAAALRRLFAGRETTGVRLARATLSGGAPPRGFGELEWSSRPRGVRDPTPSTVFVGSVWEDGAWRIRELRVLH
jgi:hypothetical protein